jgi:hypothetical protein
VVGRGRRRRGVGPCRAATQRYRTHRRQHGETSSDEHRLLLVLGELVGTDDAEPP